MGQLPWRASHACSNSAERAWAVLAAEARSYVCCEIFRAAGRLSGRKCTTTAHYGRLVCTEVCPEVSCCHCAQLTTYTPMMKQRVSCWHHSRKSIVLAGRRVCGSRALAMYTKQSSLRRMSRRLACCRTCSGRCTSPLPPSCMYSLAAACLKLLCILPAIRMMSSRQDWPSACTVQHTHCCCRRELDQIEDAAARLDSVLRGVFAGNVFDLGAPATTAAFNAGQVRFVAVASTLVVHLACVKPGIDRHSCLALNG